MSWTNTLKNIFFEGQRNQTTIDDIAERSIKASGASMGALLFGSGSNYTTEKAMNLSAVYRAVEIISDSIAQLPCEVYKKDSKGFNKKYTKHPVFTVLNNQPNVRMTRFTFIKLMVCSMLLRGNAYAYILRDSQKNVRQLVYVPNELVTINPTQFLDEPITYSICGIEGVVPADDIIHILNYTYDGIQGVSTLRHAFNSLGLAFDSEQHAANFFRGGCAIGGTLTVATSLSAKQKQDLKNSWQQAFSPETGRPNSIAILEGNMNYNPIGINPTDSQLLETRQFSVIEIARWFGVSPVKLFDLTKSSYSTVEATNISFYSDTIQPILEKFELEFERKLFPEEERGKIDVKFDVNVLLRTDKLTLANYYNTLVNNGVMNINEVRKELNLLPIENGDVNFIQANLMSVTNVANNVPANSALTTEMNEEEEEEPIENNGILRTRKN